MSQSEKLSHGNSRDKNRFANLDFEVITTKESYHTHTISLSDLVVQTVTNKKTPLVSSCNSSLQIKYKGIEHITISFTNKNVIIQYEDNNEQKSNQQKNWILYNI